ncbi:MAG: Polysaccharide biosynthesis protein [Parcubacteria group bacterium GW2011_GWA1_45_7]|nr:MAG: Polysaccharide biosynthesis protein [Parcubacteria group bacterium GW2011_GWA1_45_7]
MATLFSFLPISMAGIYLASSDVAFYKIPFGFANLALSLLGPISMMLNIEFPRLREENFSKMKLSFINITFYSIIFSGFLVICAAIISPIAFKILYGESFMPSVKYTYGFIIYGVFNGLGIGLGPMWRAINKVKVSILINTVVLAIGIPMGLYLLKHYGIWGGVVMVTVWFAISHLVSFMYLYRYLNSKS